MASYNEFFDAAVTVVHKQHSLNEGAASSLAFLRGVHSPNGFEGVIVAERKAKLECSVAGVDSGFAPKRLSFLDIALVKTAGVLFRFKNSQLSSTTYYPQPFSLPEPLIMHSGLEKIEEQQSVSLARLKKEVSCAIEMVEKFKPDFLFIDGSIVPQYQDKPNKESALHGEYHSTIELFESLYSVCEENNCCLVGCVEDSRGSRFTQILKDEVLPAAKKSPQLIGNAFDAPLLDYFLKEGERTFAFPYTRNILEHAILKDFNEKWANGVFVFYLKAARDDRPLRVEFLCTSGLGEKTSKVAGVVYALSSLHREYSFPSVLIEADLRAGLTEQEINLVYNRLVDKLGSRIKLRRTSRPFG